MSSTGSAHEQPAPPPDRSRSLAFGGLLLGGVLGLVAGAQAWWRATGGATTVGFTGNEASGGLTWALPAVLLAGTLLALVLRARGRRVVGVVLVLAGLGMVVTGVLRQRPSDQGVRTRLAQVSLVDSFALSPTAWPWVYAVAGLLAAAGAAVMLLRAARWPVRTGRFERGSAAAPVDLADDPTQAWRALDAGEDPTVRDPTPTPPDAADPIHPDVHSESSGDTMGTQRTTRREPS